METSPLGMALPSFGGRCTSLAKTLYIPVFLKKTVVLFSYPGYFLLFTGTRKPPKNIFPSRTAWVRAATACGQAKQKAEGKQVLDLPITFPALKRRAVSSARCFVDVPSDSWNKTKMMNVWYVCKLYTVDTTGGRCTFPILLCWSTSPPSELSTAGCDPI